MPLLFFGMFDEDGKNPVCELLSGDQEALIVETTLMEQLFEPLFGVRKSGDELLNRRVE